jgi:hypothetical protein
MIATITMTAPIATGLRQREFCVGVWCIVIPTCIPLDQFFDVSGVTRLTLTMIAR